MAASTNYSTDITALIVEYYERKALKESEFKNGLLKYGKKGTIPEGNSDVIHWHRWSKFALASDLTQGADPGSGIAADATDIKCKLVEFGDYIDIPLFGDAIRLDSLIQEAYPKFTEQASRTANRRTMTRLAIGDNSVSGNSFAAATKMYANGKSSFGSLETSDQLTNKDIQRAVAYIEQNQGPGKVTVLLSPWSKADVMIDDQEFRDLVKYQNLKTLAEGELPMWAGARIDQQDEPYRETLGGTEGTYAAGGSVITTYVFAEESFGVAQLMGQGGLKPKFHVQNIQKTGATMSIGYRIPFQAATLNANWVIQLKSVTRDASVSSVA